MERRSKLVQESRPRSVEKAVTGLPSLSNIAELIRHGQITVGVIRPMGCVAIANDAHQSLAMLVRRKEMCIRDSAGTAGGEWNPLHAVGAAPVRAYSSDEVERCRCECTCAKRRGDDTECRAAMDGHGECVGGYDEAVRDAF